MIYLKSKLAPLFFLLTLVTCNGEKENGCTITEFSQVSDIVSRCSEIIISNLRVPGGNTLKLNLKKGSKLTFQGTTTFEVAYWKGFLVQFSGENVHVEGAPGSVLNAQGEQYWDGHGGSGGVTKPKFVSIETKGASVFNNINLLNCASFCVGIHTSDVTISGWNIDVSAGVEKGKNTDGFDVSGHNILIENSVVKNQDDCVVVNSGSDMVFRNLQCYGSHGLSFSVGGKNADDKHTRIIKNITFLDSFVADGLYGIHLKTKYGNGAIADVTYENIEFSGILNEGIFINQDYGAEGNLDRPFEITNLKMINVHGSVGDHAVPVQIICNRDRCSNWSWSNVNLSGGYQNICNYIPPGFSC